MFKIHYDNMRPGPTPERVLAICRLVEKNSLTREELERKIYLTNRPADTAGSEFMASVNTAEELGLLELKDGKYVLKVKAAQIATPVEFRRAVAKKVFADKNTTFFMVSKWYLSSNEEILGLGNWEDKAVAAVNSGIDKVKENDMLGWRFWASFLGLGYISGTELIPNMYTRVRDVLATEFQNSFKYDEEIPVDKFFAWLWSKVPEAKMDDDTVNLALSSAIRTLRDMGEVVPLSQMDAVNMHLYRLPEDLTNKVSHIIVKEAVCK